MAGRQIALRQPPELGAGVGEPGAAVDLPFFWFRARSDSRAAGGRSKDEITRLFNGKELVDPGVVLLSYWRPEGGQPELNADRVWATAASRGSDRRSSPLTRYWLRRSTHAPRCRCPGTRWPRGEETGRAGTVSGDQARRRSAVAWLMKTATYPVWRTRSRR
ncbi:MAG: SAM-dependent methyltransferase, partial [Streptosporangiaceae bacterium]